MIRALTVPCATCGDPSAPASTKRCDDCYEVEHRLAQYLFAGGAAARTFVRAALNEAQEKVEARR